MTTITALLAEIEELRREAAGAFIGGAAPADLSLMLSMVRGVRSVARKPLVACPFYVDGKLRNLPNFKDRLALVNAAGLSDIEVARLLGVHEDTIWAARTGKKKRT